MRLGIFGGTFDPPHIGHLLAASDALEALSLDRIVFVPNAVQPLRGEAAASADDRLQMVRLLVDDDARFIVDEIELTRKGLSFTVDTVEEFAKRHPGSQLFFLAGEDVVDTFPQWRRPGRILELATFVLLTRTVGSAATGSPSEAARAAGAALLAGAVRLPTRSIDISSSEVRSRRARHLAITGFVNESVQKYIEKRGLYTQVRE